MRFKNKIMLVILVFIILVVIIGIIYKIGNM